MAMRWTGRDECPEIKGVVERLMEPLRRKDAQGVDLTRAPEGAAPPLDPQAEALLWRQEEYFASAD